MGALLLIGAGLACLHLCGVSVCLFRRLTGWPCLTCGSTRALAAVLAGDLADALRLQPLVVAGAAWAGAAAAAYSGFLVFGRRVVRVRCAPAERRFIWGAAFGLAVLNWLYLVRCGV